MNSSARLTGFHHRTVPKMLSNELYIGYRTYTEKRSAEKNIKTDGRQADRKKVKRLPDEIIRVKVIKKPVINEKVFQEVNQIIRAKNKQYQNKRSAEGERFLYSGLLKCGYCGEILYSTSGGRNHKKDYYYCRSKNYTFIRKNGTSDCTSGYMQKGLVENTITSFVGERLTENNYLNELIKLAFSQSEHENIQIETVQLNKSLKRIEKKRSKILDLYGDGLFTKNELDKKVSQLNDEISGNKIRLARLEQSEALKNKFVAEKSIQPIITTLAEFPYWAPAQKRTFLKSQMPDFSVTKEGITGFTLNFCKPGPCMGRDSWRQRA